MSSIKKFVKSGCYETIYLAKLITVSRNCKTYLCFSVESFTVLVDIVESFTFTVLVDKIIM